MSTPTKQIMLQFVNGLRCRSDDARLKTASDLYCFATNDLMELPSSEITSFQDDLIQHIFEMISSPEMNDKKGGILCIVALISVNIGNVSTSMSRFANYLRNLLPCTDVTVMEMAAKAVGVLAFSSGTYAAEYVEFEMRKALEWLATDKTSDRRHAAVLMLKEFAESTPTFFFQQIQSYFDCVFNAVWDSKAYVRECAVESLRAALSLASQREAKSSQSSNFYKQCLDKALEPVSDAQLKAMKMTRDERTHGALLVVNELLWCSNMEGERLRHDMEMLTIVGESRHQLRVEQHIRCSLRSFGSVSSVKKLQWNTSPLMLFTVGGKKCCKSVPVMESRACRDLIRNNFDKIGRMVLCCRGNRSSYIQETLVTILPRVAAFDPQMFSPVYLTDTVNFLLSLVKHDRDRSQAFQAVGLMAMSVKRDILCHLPHIMDMIRVSLPPKDFSGKKTRGWSADPSLFMCVSMLARALGPEVLVNVKDLLPSMLATGLSSALTAALREVATRIPQLKKEIQDGLLIMLRAILIGHHDYLSGTQIPNHTSRVGPAEAHEANSITLALRTIGSFDFEGHSLTQFVQHCSEHYLSSERKEIRLESVQTCSKLLTPLLTMLATSHNQISVAAITTVADVLEKLLVVGITDTDTDVRLSVLCCLDERFDPYLAQSENLSSLFMALYDEAFEVREQAMCLIGRLSSRNPALVMPSLRQILLQNLTELQYSGIGRNKEQSAKMLSHLVASTSRLICPYTDPIIKALIPKLTEPDLNPGVTVNVLACVGELAQVSGTAMSAYTNQLLPLILNMLHSSTSVQLRESVLWSLGQLIEATGCVVEPYHKYPTLLDMLLNFLKTEQTCSVRREVLRVLGLLGALDPLRHRPSQAQDQVGEAAISKSAHKTEETDYTMIEMIAYMGSNTSLEDFYPQVCIVPLMRILRDSSLSSQHQMVVHAVIFIFKSLQMKSVPYVQQVLPTYLSALRSADSAFREYLFKQLGVIITIIRHHIKAYLDEIFEMIKEFWVVQSPIQGTIISLLEDIASALGTEFRTYMSHVLPMILRLLMHDSSAERSITCRMLVALQVFGTNVSDFLHMLLPPLVKLVDTSDLPLLVRKTAVETIEHMAECVDLTDYASLIIHPLTRVLESSQQLQMTCMDALSLLADQLGVRYKIFAPLVTRVITKQRIQHRLYDVAHARIIKGSNVADHRDNVVMLRHQRQDSQKERDQKSKVDYISINKLSVQISNLHKSLSASRRVSKEDWVEWLRELSIELLRASPSPALRSCLSLAQSYNPLAKDLFNVAFVSCWSELSEAEQDELTQMLEHALTSQQIPEVIQTLLKLAEFMEHCDKGPLPLEVDLLGNRALDCRAYAKALHYKEEMFHRQPSSKTLEPLISIYNKLQQKEAAAGVIEYARLYHRTDFKVQESWYEKLHDWDQAYLAYVNKLKMNPKDEELTLGMMRCLEAMGEWQGLHQMAVERWPSADRDMRSRMAHMASAASWGLARWDSMEEYMSCIPCTSFDGNFYAAVFVLHSDNYALAQESIDKARDIVDSDLTAVASENYSRVYSVMVNAQMLCELEEIIQYKLVPERRSAIKDMWWKRLKGCQHNVDDWKRILQVRTLVMRPADDIHVHLKYASLCRKSGRMMLAQKTLINLLGLEPGKKPSGSVSASHPSITYAYLKHRWHASRQRVAHHVETEQVYEQLQHFVTQTLKARSLQMMGSEDSQEKQEFEQLMARGYLRVGRWTEDLRGITEDTIPIILEYFEHATQYDDKLYKAWHAWALMNYKAVLFHKERISPPFSGTEPENGDTGTAAGGDALPLPTRHEPQCARLRQYGVLSVQGFVRSVTLSGDSSLQDTLRLLTLWFEYGHWPDVFDALSEGIKDIHIDNWLQVIPQLIARIDTPRSLVGRLVHLLLIDIGKAHPQALIYPLTVASKSTVQARASSAQKVLRSLCERNRGLVDSALMVSEELIRVAILWHELWHEGLEEASRLYFGERNVKGMFATLEPLHAMVEKGPVTLKETAFLQAYGRDLAEAHDWCLKYQRSGNVKDITQAWDLYYHVFRRISKQLPQLTSLELQYVSPKLLAASDLELAVPGTYESSNPVIRIHRVQPSLQVITSKQRPRKLSIMGSDGREYQFLLKGHEDLRQDERVMQLFGLVNSLLKDNAHTFRRNLTITRFAAIPLSTNSGLIGWVPHCDTLHSLIRDYRERKKILLNIEHRLMLRMAPDYDHLPLMNKVEVFEHALGHTQGDDLAKILWHKSSGSEEWFDRRTNYVRSLAVMSMVGYVLGLGDRHPSNLMLDRLSGKVIHIDFGDCFEVAMTREKFPEKIPFRLTRMLINAMEATGIEGNFRMTCQKVMEVLRQNRESLMAVLEAFVYDPLLNWRLVDGGKAKEKGQPSGPYGTSQEGSGDLLDDVVGQSAASKLTGQLDGSLPGGEIPSEVMNKKAVSIINRVRDKLTGRDFDTDEQPVDVRRQVDLLIRSATAHENLCQLYIGWCPFW